MVIEIAERVDCGHVEPGPGRRVGGCTCGNADNKDPPHRGVTIHPSLRAFHDDEVEIAIHSRTSHSIADFDDDHVKQNGAAGFIV
jgi:hypothetical protein